MLLTVIFWTFVIGLSLVGALYVYLKRQGRGDYWLQRGIRVISPKSEKSLRERLKAPFHEADLGIYRQMKADEVFVGGRMEFGTRVLYIRDPELIKNVLSKDFQHFINRRSLKVGKSDPYFHKLLFNMEGQEWKDLRVTMTPTFTSAKIRNMFKIFDESAQLMVNHISTQISNNSRNESDPVELEMNLQDPIGKFTLTVIAAAAFGCESECFSNPNSLFTLMSRRFTEALTVSKISMFKFILLIICPTLFNFFGFEFFDRTAVEFFTDVVRKAINQREAVSKSNQKRDDFLQLMLDTKNGQLKVEEEEVELNPLQGQVESRTKLTDDLILAQSLLFFVAGFDTEESLLDFSCYELALNPEVQEKLFQEIDNASIQNGGKLTHEIITSLQYLDMVISETLRKYPPAFHLERRCNLDYTDKSSGLVIEKDTLVVIPVLALQHDPDIYPDPQKFIPERFSTENRGNRHPSYYLPFGMGQRACIAQRFGIIEAKVALAHLVKNFKMEPSSQTNIPMQFLKAAAGLKPANGIWLKIGSRKSL